MAAQPAGVSTTPPSSVSPANLLRVHSNSSSRLLTKKLNKTGPRTDPWGTPLVTSLQLLGHPHLQHGADLPFSGHSTDNAEDIGKPDLSLIPFAAQVTAAKGLFLLTRGWQHWHNKTKKKEQLFQH